MFKIHLEVPNSNLGYYIFIFWILLVKFLNSPVYIYIFFLLFFCLCYFRQEPKAMVSSDFFSYSSFLFVDKVWQYFSLQILHMVLAYNRYFKGGGNILFFISLFQSQISKKTFWAYLEWLKLGIFKHFCKINKCF